MKKVFFALILLASCTRSVTSPNNQIVRQHPVNTDSLVISNQNGTGTIDSVWIENTMHNTGGLRAGQHFDVKVIDTNSTTIKIYTTTTTAPGGYNYIIFYPDSTGAFIEGKALGNNTSGPFVDSSLFKNVPVSNKGQISMVIY
jgi:hypothetical protein